MNMSSIVEMLKMLINAPMKLLHSIDTNGLNIFNWDGISFD